jgi:osmotically-inducible protein OsmY
MIDKESGGPGANEAQYVAGRIEYQLATDSRTNELGIHAYVHEGVVHLRGEVACEERRRLVAEVVRETAPELIVRNEVSVAQMQPGGGEEVLP